MSKFMLIQQVAPKGVQSPEEIQDIMLGIRDWRERLEAAGKIFGGTKLADEGGKILSTQNGHTVVVDGPYSETKEVVGGFCFIEAEDYAQAVELVRHSPGLRFGAIALREVDPLGCPSMHLNDLESETEIESQGSLVS
jgi:hypothetical protein